jgi:hypothetical protein
MPFNPGFDDQEAVSMLQLCMQLNGTGRKDVPLPDVSADWDLMFDSRETDPHKKEVGLSGKKITGLGPFDNAWQLWQAKKKGPHVISIRGTIDTAHSMLDDALATTIYANCCLPVQVEGKVMSLPLNAFRKGDAGNASIHLGFTWGATILLFHKTKGILHQLLKLPKGSDIYITGHSQGAAIATLMHSILFHAGDDFKTPLGMALAGKKFRYKSYFFAQPKPGNWQYGQALAQVAGNKGMSYCINNDRDWVPQVPLAFDLPDEMTNNPVDDYLKEKSRILYWGVHAIERLARWSRRRIGNMVAEGAEAAQSYLGQHIDRRYLELFCPPDYTPPDCTSPCLNYVQCGNLLSLQGRLTKEEADDVFWQHHCGTYMELMQKQLS